MSEFTFLTEEQISGDNSLDIIKKYGAASAITDFAILLGGHARQDCYTSEGNTLKDRTGWWWAKSPDGFGDALNVNSHGILRDGLGVNFRESSVRPVLPYSSIRANSSNARIVNGIMEVEYGEYPQMIVDENYSHELYMAYKNNKLIITGKNYTTDSIVFYDAKTLFKARTHIEYEYDGKKYIKFIGDLNCDGAILSDGRRIRKGDMYWVSVEPVIWLVDEKSNTMLAKKLLFAGAQFKNIRNYKGDFEETEIKKFMDEYFSKDIIPSKVKSQTANLKQADNFTEEQKNKKYEDTSFANLNSYNIIKKAITRIQNPYNFNFDLVSEEDIIRGAVESNISVFLHGRSSDGKSARVKQLDPDCEIIYMRNATPDSLNGKSVYNADTGEMLDVPPTWFKKVKEKCEAEPDKIHIIFFDELTNALPSIQGMAFNIILDGEVNGTWKLPSNARIVAAGNDLNDSLAANQMAEPLFNRFAHVYINTTTDSWLKWASTPKERYERLDYIEKEPETKIHPSIYAYIAYKSYSGFDVLRTSYTGDKPNADPRKWEMASKMLYRTHQPEMLRALIGEELTMDFIAFTKQQVISIDDVINHNYSSGDLEMDISQKFATAVGLSAVDDEHFEVVRDFMSQVGAEPRAAFESMWAHGDEKRLERLAEIQMTGDILRRRMI